MSLVSVVIPTYNRAALVEEAVASVLAQTCPDLQLIVVDDGSSDGTEQVLRERFSDERLRVLQQDNLGASAARNRGAAESSGEWLAFLDSDDLWLPHKLERQLHALHREPDCACCYTEEIWYRRGRRVNPRKVHAKYDGWIFDHCLPLCIISPSSILLRRQLYEELGGFDPTFPACEDYELWLRLTARHPVRFLPEPLIVKRNGHAGQLSQQFWGMDRFRIRALWSLVLRQDLPWALAEPALRTIAAKSAVVAAGAGKRGAMQRAAIYRYSQEEAMRWIERGKSS